VKTIYVKLRLDESSDVKDTFGGSTYTFVGWNRHPFDDLRARVDAYNAEHGVPDRHR
jgi:hypothetical protein